MTISYTLENISEIAQTILDHSKNKVVLFYAEMGTGKTTLIKEISKLLGSQISSSPTFSIVNEYTSSNSETFYHFDCYRIEDEEEAYDIGIEEYLYSDNWCFIEWPENVENLLPLDAQVIRILTNSDFSRTITIE